MADHTENSLEDAAERMRQQADAALTRRMRDPQRLTPAALVHILFPVIEKHLAAGLTLDDVASTLQEDGFAIKRSHLVRHLGALRAERGLQPLKRGPREKAAGAKEDQPAAPAAAPAPAQPQTRPAPPASPRPAPSSPAPFPEIPRGELTHTERAEIAKKWIDEQFGGRHPSQVKPDELTPAAQEWLEKLWDKPAPVNPKTGQPYAFKRFTPDGRITYDEPWWPPEAVAMENSKSGYHPVHDAATRETLKKYGLRLIATSDRLMEIRDKNGKYCVGGFGQDDAACLIRSVRETAQDIERERMNGIPY